MTLIQRLGGMRILLVDDDKLIRNSLSMYFNNNEGIILMSVGSAEEALAELSTNQYDILILDYKLSGLDGLDVLKRIQKSHPNMIKVFITAFGSDELFDQAMELGASDTIEKPLSIEKLEESLTRLIAA